jgi:hypothetical protein
VQVAADQNLLVVNGITIMVVEVEQATLLLELDLMHTL